MSRSFPKEGSKWPDLTFVRPSRCTNDETCAAAPRPEPQTFLKCPPMAVQKGLLAELSLGRNSVATFPFRFDE